MDYLKVFYFAACILLIHAIEYNFDKRSKKCFSNSDCGEKEYCSWRTKDCNRYFCSIDSDCFPNEYCQLRNKRDGVCRIRRSNRDGCIFDSRCLSHNFLGHKSKNLHLKK